MRRSRALARTVAAALAGLSLFALWEPMAGIADTVSVYLDPTVSFRQPSGTERLRRDAGKMLLPVTALILAAVGWLVADIHLAQCGNGVGRKHAAHKLP